MELAVPNSTLAEVSVVVNEAAKQEPLEVMVS